MAKAALNTAMETGRAEELLMSYLRLLLTKWSSYSLNGKGSLSYTSLPIYN
uniref:Uncharacterized protein n=1 Tax=Anguilla anguilla TaxID=7936 RepID=A0A0E9U6T1_ANGAN